MTLLPEDQNYLRSVLKSVTQSVEDLLLTGLTTASTTTLRALDVSFREASRMRLLRLGSTLRALTEELRRFTERSDQFSSKRLTFFLNRSWMLCRGLSQALNDADDTAFHQLLRTPSTRPFETLDLVCLGVVKKEVSGVYCAFEFRLRPVTVPGDQPRPRQFLSWSCVFPLKQQADFPAEAFLHLPQKQKFTPNDLLQNRQITMKQGQIAYDQFGNGRISFNDDSRLELGGSIEDWTRCLHWDAGAAIERISSHTTTPFDLEVELQEEITLHRWTLGDRIDDSRDGQFVYPICQDALELDAIVSKSREGEALRSRISDYVRVKSDAKKIDEEKGVQSEDCPPPIFGLMHYEMCRLIFQPLTVFSAEGPIYMTISDEKIDRAALVKTLDFS